MIKLSVKCQQQSAKPFVIYRALIIKVFFFFWGGESRKYERKKNMSRFIYSLQHVGRLFQRHVKKTTHFKDDDDDEDGDDDDDYDFHQDECWNEMMCIFYMCFFSFQIFVKILL